MPFYVPIYYSYSSPRLSLSTGMSNIHSSVSSNEPSMNPTRTPSIFIPSVLSVEPSSGISYFPKYYPNISKQLSSCTVCANSAPPQIVKYGENYDIAKILFYSLCTHNDVWKEVISCELRCHAIINVYGGSFFYEELKYPSA